MDFVSTVDVITTIGFLWEPNIGSHCYSLTE